MSRSDGSAVLAAAGRRVDAAGAVEKRFPLENAGAVRKRLVDVLEGGRFALVVASAACGADLLVLDVARETGLPSLIVLPGDKQEFRANSVADRPGEWTSLFDSIVDDAERRNRLLIVTPKQDETPYYAASRVIVEQARDAAAALHARFKALAIWDGRERGDSDYTAGFLDLATRAGAEILPSIDTLHSTAR